MTLEVAHQLETDALFAERLGWIQSTDTWLMMRKLRNLPALRHIR